MAERKYALTRLGRGDYLLPSNDGATLWRIRTYVDGPSAGLDIPRDRTFWSVWKCHGIIGPGMQVDPDDEEAWEFYEGLLETRREAIGRALELEPE